MDQEKFLCAFEGYLIHNDEAQVVDNAQNENMT